MNINKKIIISLIIIIVIGLGFLLWKNFKGALPAVTDPDQNIADIIKNSNQNISGDKQTPPEKQNETDFPLTLPNNFYISVYAENLNKPRDLIYDPNDNLLVSDLSAGQVIALPDYDNNGEADEKVIVYEDLYNPHGILFHCQDQANCKLYIAETNQVAIYDYDLETMKASNKQKIIDLPDDGGHYTRSLETSTVNGQEKLLISVGSSCNVCNESNWRRSKVLMSNLDGSNLETYASGLRNAVFLNTHPNTGQIWATEMGRDWLGDNAPPDEINILEPGQDYGWPICYGQNTHDSNFDKNQYIQDPCTDKIPAYIDLQAHSAPLGLDFFDDSWPQEYQDDLLVAYHGSWNRSVPTGYKIMHFTLDENGRVENKKDFISGWLTNNSNSLGRPVDVLINNQEKNIFISDDKAGLIYSLKYFSK